MLTSSLKWCAMIGLLLAAVPACGNYYEPTTPTAYASSPTTGTCSFANRTQDICIARCAEDDAASCNDVGRLLELHATSVHGMEEARHYFDRACGLGVSRACKNSARIDKRRAAALRTAAPSPHPGDDFSL